MKRLKLFNLLFALFIAFAGLNFASCSDDNNIPEVTPPAEEEDVHVKNPAGDDFYMYVNEAWHKEQAPGDESLGYINDVNQVLAKKLQETTKTMEDLKAVAESYNRMMATDQQANLERVDAIVDEMLGKIKTKTDAYRMVGECFAAGLMDRNFKLYPMIHEGKVYATFGPGTDNPEANEIYNRPHKYMLNNKFYKFSAQSRSIDEVFKTLAEGIGLNDDYLIGGEEMAAFLTELSQKTLDELKDGIREAIEGELLPYCGDEYAQSEAKYPSTHDYLFGFQLEKLFGYSMSYYYSTQYVTDERKELFKEYGKDLKASFANRIQNNAWLSSATKQEALNKLDKMKCYYGRPDVWLEEGLRVPDKDLLVDNIVEMKKIRTELIGALLGKDRYDVLMIVNILAVGGMHLADYNAYYDPVNNAFFVHPCFMIDPEFTPEMKKGEMYALFYILGHEITHGFDLEGSLRDADGNENNWWTTEDRMKFESLNEKMIHQINTFEMAPGMPTDGKRTVTEDVADLGGMNIALDALVALLKKQGASDDEIKAEQKNFFEYHAKRHRIIYSAEDLQGMQKDEHSVNKIRVNGIFQHMDTWYDLYNVVEGDSLYLPKEKRVTIW